MSARQFKPELNELKISLLNYSDGKNYGNPFFLSYQMATIFPQTHRGKTHTGYDSSLYENAQQKHEKSFRNSVCVM